MNEYRIPVPAAAGTITEATLEALEAWMRGKGMTVEGVHHQNVMTEVGPDGGITKIPGPFLVARATADPWVGVETFDWGGTRERGPHRQARQAVRGFVQKFDAGQPIAAGDRDAALRGVIELLRPEGATDG
jgi:hypothetical protein